MLQHVPVHRSPVGTTPPRYRSERDRRTRAYHSTHARAVVPVPRATVAHRELEEFSLFLAKHTVGQGRRVVCVTGDSSSLLVFLYQQLPAALAAQHQHCRAQTWETGEIRLVTHELASQGLAYCSSTQQFVTVTQQQQQQQQVPHPTQTHNSSPPPVRWYVPRILANGTHLDTFLSLWLPPRSADCVPSEACQRHSPRQQFTHILLFINTDIADDGLLAGHNDGTDRFHEEEKEAGEVDGAGERHPVEGSLCFNDQIVQALPAYFLRAEVPPSASGCAPLAATFFPVLHLSSVCPFLDRHRRTALAALQAHRDLAPFFRLAVSPSGQSGLLPRQSMGGWAGGAASSTHAGMHHLLRPSVYADAAALAQGLRAMERRHSVDALIVENLNDLHQQRAEATRTGMDHGSPPTATTRAVRRYYPLASHVSDLLHRRCCLSDVFVVELSTDTAFLSECTDRWRHRRGGSGTGSHDKDSALYAATMAFAAWPTIRTGRQAEQRLCDFIDAACTARRAFCWTLGEDERDVAAEYVPRVAMCFSYEVFSPQVMEPLLQQERGMASDQEPLREEDLPSTLGFLVRRLLAALRERGWVLVHQESHHTWDSAADWSDGPGVAKGHTLSELRWALWHRVVESADAANYDRQSILQRRRERLHHRQVDSSPVTRGALGDDTDDRRRRTHGAAPRKANGDFVEPTGVTSTELWEATIVSQRRGRAGVVVALWKGARVALPNGRCGVVVGFAPPPPRLRCERWRNPSAGNDSSCLPSHDKHREFARWLRATPDSRYRWKPCLPSILSTRECGVWPVVLFLDSDRPTLVLPSLVEHHDVEYPTWCTVSALQQHSIAHSHSRASFAAPSMSGDGAGSARGTEPEPLPPSPPRPSLHYHVERLCEGEDNYNDATWRVHACPDGAAVTDDTTAPSHALRRNACVTTTALPLTTAMAETPASLFYAAVLLGGAGGLSFWDKTPCCVADPAALARWQPLQQRWRALHMSRRIASLRDASMGAAAPTPLPLRSTWWLLRVGSFLGKPRALRCVIAAVPNTNRITVDNPSMLSLVRGTKLFRR